MKNSVSIIIVNYNGRELLGETISTVLNSARESGLEYEVIVIDNASTDSSLDFLKEKYPEVITMPMKTNNYWFSVNKGIEKSSENYLLLLNNDVKLERRCVRYLFEQFNRNSSTLFAAVPRELDWSGRPPAKGAQGLEIKNELFMESTETFDFDKPHITFNAGNAMYSREKLIKLGMFDELFLPFYYEDFDLSYRAWKSGFEIIYEPKAVIYHKRRATINKYVPKEAQLEYGVKNSLLFIWKNVTDPALLCRHFLYLPVKLFKSLFFFRSKKENIFGFMLALGSLKQLIASRKKVKSTFTLSDKEVLDRLNIERNFCEKA